MEENILDILFTKKELVQIIQSAVDECKGLVDREIKVEFDSVVEENRGFDYYRFKFSDNEDREVYATMMDYDGFFVVNDIDNTTDEEQETLCEYWSSSIFESIWGRIQSKLKLHEDYGDIYCMCYFMSFHEAYNYVLNKSDDCRTYLLRSKLPALDYYQKG